MHLHLIAFAWLIGEEMASAVLAWLYTVGAAATVNLLAGHSIQRVVGGALFCLGALGLLLLAPSMQPALQVLSLSFMFKVIYAFGVDHRAESR